MGKYYTEPPERKAERAKQLTETIVAPIRERLRAIADLCDAPDWPAQHAEVQRRLAELIQDLTVQR
jgi:hypothetical protein